MGLATMEKAQAELRTLDDLLADAWVRIGSKLNAMYGDAIFRSWLKPIRFAGSEDNRILLSVPTRFVREWVGTHYGEQISALWLEEQVAEGYGIEFVVAAAGAVPAAAEPQAEAAAAAAGDNVITAAGWQAADPVDSELHMGAALDPRTRGHVAVPRAGEHGLGDAGLGQHVGAPQQRAGADVGRRRGDRAVRAGRLI
ncbi:MAG: hypothetical protein K2Q01_10105, partial [Rickettsiales bacterium]|nr:hypothetical protein [Rickettsiales bacterium]